MTYMEVKEYAQSRGLEVMGKTRIELLYDLAWSYLRDAGVK